MLSYSHHIRDSKIFSGDPKFLFSFETPSFTSGASVFLWRPPAFMGDPKLFITFHLKLLYHQITPKFSDQQMKNLSCFMKI